MKLSLAALLLAFAASAFAAPAQIIIFRHGEKPDTGNELDPQGQQRAQALVNFFENDPAVTQYGAPAAIYAMAPSSDDGSVRPIQTVTPLAQNLGLPINKNFTKDQGPAVVKDILGNKKYDGKMVLVCWEHKAIPGLAQDFGYDSAPAKWKGSDFYSVWIFNLDTATGKVTSFKIISEHVMPGDPAN
jgi:hypothetical protein